MVQLFCDPSAGPCVPLRAAADKVCGNNTAVMSWEAREGVDFYTARALGAGGVLQELCNSTSSTCSFSNLGCGETYAFTVTAYSGLCQSSGSAPVYLTTGIAVCSVKNPSQNPWAFNQKKKYIYIYIIYNMNISFNNIQNFLYGLVLFEF